MKKTKTKPEITSREVMENDGKLCICILLLYGICVYSRP